MNNVSFFRSIQLKFIIIYILLLLIAIQVIGSYFVRELETELLDTFKGSITDRVDLLNYNVTQSFERERSEEYGDESLQDEIQRIIYNIDITSITNLQVVNNQIRVIAKSDYSNCNIIGKKPTQDIIQKTILFTTSH